MTAAPVIGLGCRLNIAESERIAALLNGTRDKVVVNSCAVTGEAVRQTRRAIRRARRAHPRAQLFVTGCAAETERAMLAAMPEVDALIPNARKLLPASYGLRPAAGAAPAARTRAFVPVQNGCDHACTFCIIPRGRGASRSVPIAAVLAEIAAHRARGVMEIVLTGVDVTAWGADLPGGGRLGDLVAAILHADAALPRLRLSSLDGAEIDPLLFELIAGAARIMPHLHLSLQHGHDLILKRMKRRHNRAQAVAIVEALRARRPDLAVGADLIAGFPTESDAHHEANMTLIRELGIVHGHIFPYSPRPDTPASRMPPVPEPVIRARAAALRAVVADERARWLRSLVGTPLRVLVERDGRGYAENYARVAVPGLPPSTILTITPQTCEDDFLR